MGLYTLSQAETLLDALQKALLEMANRGGIQKVRTGSREATYSTLEELNDAIRRAELLVQSLTKTTRFRGVAFRKPA